MRSRSFVSDSVTKFDSDYRYDYHADYLGPLMGALAGAAGIAGLSALGSTIGGLFSSRNTDRTNSTNADISAMTNATNKQIAEQNLAFQRENLDYQKALQQQIFAREDTAYQRTVDDMRAAGLSPLSMQNTNGAGEAIQTDALNNGFEAQGYTALKSSAFEDLGNSLINLTGNMAQIDSLKAQAQKTSAEAADITIGNKYKALLLDEQLRKARYDADIRGGESWLQGQKMDYYNHFGLNDSMTDSERTSSILARSLGLIDDTGRFSDDSFYLDSNGRWMERSKHDLNTVGLFNSGIHALTGLANFLPAKDIFAIARGFGRSKKQNFKDIRSDNYRELLDLVLPF